MSKDMFETSSSSDDNSVNLLEGISAEVAMKEDNKENETESEYQELLRLREENMALKKEKEHTAIILARYEKTLDLFEKEKNGLEDKLYSKFLPVLNAKKEEILRLQTLLNSAGGCGNKRQKQ